MPREPGGQLVEREFLTLAVWDHLDAQTAETVARAVEACLPEPWTFSRVAWHECGDQKRHVAFFDWNGKAFALIPGGEVTLGYDPQRPAPSSKLLGDWYEEAQAMAEHYPELVGITWERYLATQLSQSRRVRLAPYLVAVRGEAKTHDTGAAERGAIAQQDFSLPTADQWAFACSAGSRSAWHWGDDPTGGPPETNAFGLIVAQNTYHKEALDEPGHSCGGDGGVRECGGCCELEWFVSLSSWYSEKDAPTHEDWWHGGRFRRVFPLPDSMFG